MRWTDLLYLWYAPLVIVAALVGADIVAPYLGISSRVVKATVLVLLLGGILYLNARRKKARNRDDSIT
jgi:hypothetical protein